MPPGDEPTVHLLCGYAASGKTTFARRISAEAGAVRFTLDEWMLSLYDLVPSDPSYGPAAARAKELIWSVALQCLSRGLDVVLDWSQWSRLQRSEWSARARQAGARAVVHHLDLPLETALQRLAARNLERPPGTHVLDPREARRFFEAFFEPPGPDEGLEIVLEG